MFRYIRNLIANFIDFLRHYDEFAASDAHDESRIQHDP